MLSVLLSFSTHIAKTITECQVHHCFLLIDKIGIVPYTIGLKKKTTLHIIQLFRMCFAKILHFVWCQQSNNLYLYDIYYDMWYNIMQNKLFVLYMPIVLFLRSLSSLRLYQGYADYPSKNKRRILRRRSIRGYRHTAPKWRHYDVSMGETPSPPTQTAVVPANCVSGARYAVADVCRYIAKTL